MRSDTFEFNVSLPSSIKINMMYFRLLEMLNEWDSGCYLDGLIGDQQGQIPADLLPLFIHVNK